VNRGERVRGFELDHEFFIDEHADAQFTELRILVNDRDRNLTRKWNPAQTKCCAFRLHKALK
jgi:hypothetical protein